MELPQMNVGPLTLTDASEDDILAFLAQKVAVSSGPVAVLDLHVSSLLQSDDPRYLKVLKSAAVTYADGVSIYLLARLAGARSVDRLPLTEFGHRIVDSLARDLERPLRLGLIGGEPDVVANAARALERQHGVSGMFFDHGFHPRWDDVLDRLESFDPDLVFVGMGIPGEALWIDEQFDRLPNCLFVTCGGWFVKLAGRERRAPTWMSTIGMEWVWRLLQDPRRLAGRYAHGALAFALLLVKVILRRLTRPAN